ncbi:hypothetical protein HZA73_08845 [candidate division TA06 bacterium]|nr:hypothetical protein [candidate division TA06 bacterium]
MPQSNDNGSFLPPLLPMAGEWSTIVDELYKIFVTDFKWNSTFHNNLRVDYNRTINEDGQGKEEGFWHVVSKDQLSEGGIKERLPDYRRAERLPWAKVIMTSGTRPEITIFDYKEGPQNKGVRRNIWLREYNYCLILQHKKTKYYWVTAFHVDEEYNKTLTKHYEKRV